jgi:heme/copper-type cytochrome/quinol oxidase subunit 3
MTTDVNPDTTETEEHTEFHQDMAFQPRANRIGLWLFIVSETFLFSAFLSASPFQCVPLSEILHDGNEQA